MSILQVSNVSLDSTGNVKILYESNNITFSTNNSNLNFSAIKNTAENFVAPGADVGRYFYSIAKIENDPGFVEVTNNALLKSDYPALGQKLGSNPWPDLDNITVTQSTTTGFIYGLAYGNNVYVGVGQNGKIESSVSGVLAVRTAVDGNTLYTVTYGNGVFVAGGNSGVVARSIDGVTWSKMTSPMNTMQIITTSTYENGYFVIGGVGPSIAVSTDGVTWSKTINSGDSSRSISTITFGNGIYYAMSYDNSPGTGPAKQAYGSYRAPAAAVTSAWPSWLPAALNFSNTSVSDYISSAAFGNGIFVGVSNKVNSVRHSIDAITWKYKSVSTADMLTDESRFFDATGNVIATGKMKYLNNTFITIVAGNEPNLYTSPDGSNWTLRKKIKSENTSESYINDIIFDGTNYVLAGVANVSGTRMGAYFTLTNLDNTFSYSTSTHFKTPPFNGLFSPISTVDILGDTVNTYIYMKA